MAREFVEVLDMNPATVVVSGAQTTVWELSDNALFPTGVPGGMLGDQNSLWFYGQAIVNLSTNAAAIVVRFKYGTALVATATFGILTEVVGATGLLIEGLLSADGGPNLQVSHIACRLGTSPANISGNALGVGSGAEDSSVDQLLSVTIEVTNGGAAAASVIYNLANIGNGVFAVTPTVGGSAENGDYLLTCIIATPGAGTFSVSTPTGGTLGDLTVGTPYATAHFSGTLNDGSVDFSTGDKITVRVATGAAVTFQHAALQLVSFVEDAATPESDTPLTFVNSISRLTLFPHSLFKDITFYGEFLHHLDFHGFGSAVVTRATPQNATWRDSGSHSIAANLPRFEWDTALDVPKGLLINSAVSETLTIAGNNLHDGNTLFWREDNVTFHSPSTTNPFNSSGVWTGNNNKHISYIVKFNRVLNSVELSIVTNILDGAYG